MCKHQFKFDRQSKIITNDNRKIIVDVFKCLNCKGIRILDSQNGKIITVNNKMGKEV